MGTGHERLKTVSGGTMSNVSEERNKFKKKKSVEVTAGSMVIRLKRLQNRMRRKELRKATTAQELERFM